MQNFTQEDMKIIYKLAWSFHRTTGLELDELIGEAGLCAARVLKGKNGTGRPTHTNNKGVDYSQDRSAFRTHLHNCIRNHLSAWAKDQYKIDTTMGDEMLEMESMDSSPEQAFEFKQELNCLSPSAKQIAKMIFESPCDWLEYRPKMAQGALRDKLREMGWKYERIWNAMREVKQFVRSRQ